MLTLEYYKPSIKNEIIAILFFIFICAIFTYIGAQIYHWTLLFNYELIAPQKEKKQLIIECGTKMMIQNIVRDVAEEHNVSRHLVLAILETESSYRTKITSNKGAMGLMQIMPLIANTYNVDDPFDPHQNIQAGTQYIKYLLEKFDGDIEKTIAAYNAGETKVRQLGRVPRFKETLNYVKKVSSLYEKYTQNT